LSEEALLEYGLIPDGLSEEEVEEKVEEYK